VFIIKLMKEANYLDNYFERTPSYVGIPWALILCLFLTWFLLYFGVPSLRRIAVTRTVLNMIWYAMFVVACAMCAMANVDIRWQQQEFDAFAKKHNLWW
jgi:hypothetical protein